MHFLMERLLIMKAPKMVLNPIPPKKPPTKAKLAKAEEKTIPKVLLKELPKVPKTSRQARVQLQSEFITKMIKQHAKDLEDPKAAKARKKREDAKIAKMALLATPVLKEAYNEMLGATITERVSNGEHLPDVLKSLDVKFSVFSHWVRTNKAFRELFQLAREAQAHAFISEIVKIADNATGKGELEKIKISTRQWLASKILAPLYGERVVHSGDSENPVITKLVSDSQELLGKIRGGSK